LVTAIGSSPLIIKGLLETLRLGILLQLVKSKMKFKATKKSIVRVMVMIIATMFMPMVLTIWFWLK
jgi:hypothetical protein